MLKIRNLLRPIWVRLIIAALLALGLTSLARISYRTILTNNNIAQIEELNLRSLKRAEILVDYAVESLADLQLHGLSSCDAQALTTIRQISFSRGSIKDIQVLDANHGLLCAGAAIGRQLGEKNFDFTAAFPAEDEHIYFHDITRNNSGILGVARHVDADTTFLAVLNLDSLLFGVFPEQLRERARADLIMGNRVEVATQFPTGAPNILPSELRVFSSNSSRYPLSVEFNVDAAALLAWNSESEKTVADTSLVVGLFLGWLLLLFLGRPIPFAHQLQIALHNREFVPFMQPTFDIQSGKIVGCEVLVRWVKPNGDVVPPFRFIPTAEESG